MHAGMNSKGISSVQTFGLFNSDFLFVYGLFNNTVIIIFKWGEGNYLGLPPCTAQAENIAMIFRWLMIDTDTPKSDMSPNEQ
jgi:hypothetical protein